MTEDSKIVGDENIVPIDQESFFENVHVGDKIAIDYGQVVLKVVEIEDQFVVLQKLMNQFPDKYPTIEQFRNPSNRHQISSPNSDGNDENIGDQSQSSDNKMTVLHSP